MPDIITIPLAKLYHGYKEKLVPIYDKYFRHNGNPLLWENTPIAIFAVDYAAEGKKILEKLDEHVFIRYEYDRYADADTVKNDTHKFNAAKRVMSIVDSIRKHGYAKGKFKASNNIVRVMKGFKSPYGEDKDGYTLLSRKHRAAGCVGAGLKEMKVRVYG